MIEIGLLRRLPPGRAQPRGSKTKALTIGRDSGAGWSCVEYGRLRRCLRCTRVVEPPPSRLTALSAPSSTITSASSGIDSPPSTRERRPSHATARTKSAEIPSAARGCRPSVMSESNCPAPAENPSRSSLGSKTTGAVADEQRPRVHQVSLRRVGRLVAWSEADVPALDDHAGAAGSVRVKDLLVGHGAATDPEIAQRAIGIAKEEAADDRLVDLVPRAPDVEPLGAREVHYPGAGRTARVPDRVEGRHLAIGELVPPQQVLDPVRHRRGFSSPWGQHSVRPHLARPSAGAIAASQTDRRRFLPPNQTIGVHCGRRGGKSRGRAALGRRTRASARAGARGHGARSCLWGGR